MLAIVKPKVYTAIGFFKVQEHYAMPTNGLFWKLKQGLQVPSKQSDFTHHYVPITKTKNRIHK